MRKIVTLRKLVVISRSLGRQGKSIVFTNGTFDILHRGHIEYLAKASRLGDVLMVGLNSDSSIRRIKGKGRPINNSRDRSAVLAALEVVDYVCLFAEDTPQRIIKRLVPDVLVKGADWKVQDIVGKEVVERRGGCVRTISLTPGRSTSNIVAKILKAYSHGSP